MRALLHVCVCARASARMCASARVCVRSRSSVVCAAGSNRCVRIASAQGFAGGGSDYQTPPSGSQTPTRHPCPMCSGLVCITRVAHQIPRVCPNRARLAQRRWCNADRSIVFQRLCDVSLTLLFGLPANARPLPHEGGRGDVTRNLPRNTAAHLSCTAAPHQRTLGRRRLHTPKTLPTNSLHTQARPTCPAQPCRT